MKSSGKEPLDWAYTTTMEKRGEHEQIKKASTRGMAFLAVYLSVNSPFCPDVFALSTSAPNVTLRKEYVSLFFFTFV